jgi:hypothetical protein
MGAARVLDMEVEDLQLLALGHCGRGTCDVLLYDPMPGGSGLLEQLTERWIGGSRRPLRCSQGARCLRDVVHRLPTDVPQPLLPRAPRPPRRNERPEQRQRAADQDACRSPSHLPDRVDHGPAADIHRARFKRLLAAAGLPAPLCQHRIDLGAGIRRHDPRLLLRGRRRRMSRDLHLPRRHGGPHPRQPTSRPRRTASSAPSLTASTTGRRGALI